MYVFLKLDKTSLFYNIIYLTRRIILSFVCIYMSDFSGQQIQLTIFVNTLVMIYVGRQRPFNERMLNTKELVNEYFILCLTTNLIGFSALCDDFNTQYDV